MAGTDPGDRLTPEEARARRQLERPPSDRYARTGSAGRAGSASGDGPETAAAGSALAGPLLRAIVAATAGAGLLVLVGAILASTVGLLFISGAIGATVGLVLARAAAPTGDARPLPRRTVTVLALVLTLGAIAGAAIATWLYARSEGGTLDLLDYLLTTFGPFIPGELVLGTIAAAWGANAGPVQR